MRQKQRAMTLKRPTLQLHQVRKKSTADRAFINRRRSSFFAGGHRVVRPFYNTLEYRKKLGLNVLRGLFQRLLSDRRCWESLQSLLAFDRHPMARGGGGASEPGTHPNPSTCSSVTRSITASDRPPHPPLGRVRNTITQCMLFRVSA